MMSNSSKSSKENQEFKIPPKQKFQEGEKVLCYHGPLIYEAKCMHYRYDEKQKTFQYHIHYSGWNKSWDEWVPEVRVLKYNETNLQKQSDLKKAQKGEPKTKKRRSTSGKESKEKREEIDVADVTTPLPVLEQSRSTGLTSTSDERVKKRRVKPESDEPGEQIVTINVKMNETLVDLLVDDWSIVNLEKKMVKLPPSLTVDDICNQYLSYKDEHESVNSDITDSRKEVINGVREYFNIMVPSQLLYNEERDQYDSVISKYGEEVNLCEIYGAIHLLRMFIRLGWAMGYTRFDEISVDLFLCHINEFMQYLTARSSSYFGPNHYISVAEENED